MDKKKIIIHIPNYLIKNDNKHYIKWANNIGKEFYIEYQDKQYGITIKNVDVDRQTLMLYANNKEISISMAQVCNKLRQQEKDGKCIAGKLFYLIDNKSLIGDTGNN